MGTHAATSSRDTVREHFQRERLADFMPYRIYERLAD